VTFTGRTLASSVRLEGLGLHSGVPVHVTIHPASRGGVRFRHAGAVVVAHPGSVTDTTRCTRLGDVSTIEHLMSALAVSEVTDVEIELDAPELPALDGSALGYWESLQDGGFEDLDERELPDLFSRLFLHEDLVKVAISAGEGHWRYDYDTGDRWPGLQSAEFLRVVEEYGAEIAPARTFGLQEELPAIQAAGLAKGLDLQKALLLGPSGYLNEPRFPNEPARHKLLDLIGDLYLAGVPIRFLNVVAERSGHRTNVQAAALLAEAVGKP